MTEINYDQAAVVITGAGGGIGEALSRGFAREGAAVAVCDIDEAAANDVADSIGDAAIAFEVDVAQENSVRQLADDVFAAFGSVDVLCNNAGVFQGGLMWERSVADFRWAFDVNCFAIIHAISAFVPRMLEHDRPSHIVNTSSVAAYVSAPFTSPYMASKAAAFSLTECLAHDLAAVGAKIGASVLTPSAFDTEISRTASARPTRYGSDNSADATAIAEALGDMTAAGMDPAAAFAPVLEGIRENTFLIATKPSFRTQLEHRFSALAQQQLPTVADVD
ncbi:MAG: SDR family NAD(P)-dependent oxidoreductase [Acidobacteria bacterium]|nr:SDR family NAD(P)-dependent oxidoreductase [Acidobacteriota bacterium]